MKRIIINADDFGLTLGVNRAITELHRRHVLSSTTLMANASATTEAIGSGKENPTLGIGCHVVLVDGRSMLEPRKDLVWLIDSNKAAGAFKKSLIAFLEELYFSRQSTWPFQNRNLEREIEAEACVQISSLQARGVHLTHIDTHKHTHIYPRVLRPLLRAARTCGVTTIRNPFEPAWSRLATPSAPLLRRTQVRLLQMLEKSFLRIVAEEGFITTHGSTGVLATGTLDTQALTSLLRAMPEGTWELVTHPAYNDVDLASAGTRLLASREVELCALRDLALQKDIELIHYGQI